jgi:hypothetical protein
MSTIFIIMMIVMGWILFYSTVNLSVTAATDNEVGIWIVECICTSSYSCNRVTLYLLGECESKKLSPVPDVCEGSIKEYVTENGLQNERRLTQDEVVEDFRILEQLPPANPHYYE